MTRYENYRYSREIAEINDTGEKVTPKMAIARGITKNSNNLVCCQCGKPLIIAAIEEKKQKMHFRGKCKCNLETKEIIERGSFGKKIDSQADDKYVNFRTYSGEKLKFLVKDVIIKNGYDIFIDTSNRKVAVLQSNSNLNPKKLGIKLVNEITANGFVYLWSEREEKELKEQLKNYEFYKNKNIDLEKELIQINQKYRELEKKKEEKVIVYNDSEEVIKLKNKITVLEYKNKTNYEDIINKQAKKIKSLEKELALHKKNKLQYRLL